MVGMMVGEVFVLFFDQCQYVEDYYVFVVGVDLEILYVWCSIFVGVVMINIYL